MTTIRRLPLNPTRINIATSSASVSACAPFDNSRSRGRSSCGHDAMPVAFVFGANILLVPANAVGIGPEGLDAGGDLAARSPVEGRDGRYSDDRFPSSSSTGTSVWSFALAASHLNSTADWMSAAGGGGGKGFGSFAGPV